MSHVDEGVLHAYLDGGLSALDAVRVERHVSDCGPCRQRLDQARALIQRAARLLEWASPPADRAAPPLAGLRPATAPRWRVPVAWAATIVIALGVGIYGGSMVLRGTAGESDRRTSSGPVALHDSSRDAAAVSRANPITVLAAAESTQRDEAAKVRPAQPEPGTVALGTVVTQESTAAMNRVALAPPAKALVDTARQPVVVIDGGLAGAAAADSVAARRERRQLALTPAPAAEPQARLEESRVAAPSRPQRASGYALGTTWPVITRDSATRLLQTGIVALPDVPINSVRATNDGVVVEHVLPPGQVVRLIQRRAADGEESNAAPGSELLARYIGGLRVEISGTLPADSLSRLLERVRAIP